jgi:hypothetical protein
MATQNHPSLYERRPSVFSGWSSEGLEFARACRSHITRRKQFAPSVSSFLWRV